MTDTATTSLLIPGIDVATNLKFNSRPDVKVVKRTKNLKYFLSFYKEFTKTLSYYAKVLNKHPEFVMSDTDQPCVVLILDRKFHEAYRIDVREFVDAFLDTRLQEKPMVISLHLFVKALQSFKTRAWEAYRQACQEYEDSVAYDCSTDAQLNDQVQTITFTQWNYFSSYYEDDIVVYVDKANKYQQGMFFKAIKNIPAQTPFNTDNFQPLNFTA